MFCFQVQNHNHTTQKNKQHGHALYTQSTCNILHNKLSIKYDTLLVYYDTDTLYNCTYT